MFSLEGLMAEQGERRRWEGVVADLQSANNRLANRVSTLQADLHSSESSGWGSYAQGYVLHLALQAVDPEHPLVADNGNSPTMVNIFELGAKAYGDGQGDVKARVKAVATSFKLPERPCVKTLLNGNKITSDFAMKLVAENKELKAENEALKKQVETLRNDLIDYMAQREAMRADLARFDADHPLVHNAELRQRISQAGRRAFALSGGDYLAVKEAGLTFMGAKVIRPGGKSDGK